MRALKSIRIFAEDSNGKFELTPLAFCLQTDVANSMRASAIIRSEDVPDGADTHIMKNIIHDWDDEQAITILKNCYQAMPKNAKLLLVEAVIFPGNEPSVAKLLDLEMLVLTGGQERTEAQHQALFQAAGLQLTKIVSTNSWQSIIEAIRL